MAALLKVSKAVTAHLHLASINHKVNSNTANRSMAARPALRREALREAIR